MWRLMLLWLGKLVAITVAAAVVCVLAINVWRSSEIRPAELKPLQIRGGPQVVSIDAKERMLIASKSPWLIGLGKIDPSAADTLTVCAEPSPDALSVLSRNSSVDATFKDVLAKYAAGASETGSNIGLRTPSIQSLRDGMFRLCEAFSAGALSPSLYGVLLQKYQTIQLALISVEQLTGMRQVKNSGPKAAPHSREKSEDDKRPVNVSTQPTAENKEPDEASYDIKSVADAVSAIVTKVIDEDGRLPFCINMLSSPPATIGPPRQEPDGSMSFVTSRFDDAARDGCLAWLFPQSAQTQAGDNSPSNEAPKDENSTNVNPEPK